MKIVQVSPLQAHQPYSGAPSRIHGLMVGQAKSDTISRYVFKSSSKVEPWSHTREIQIKQNYTEYVRSSFCHGFLNELFSHIPFVNTDSTSACSISHTMRIDKTPVLPGLMVDSDIIFVEFPWQVPYISQVAPSSTTLVYSSHNVESEYHEYLSEDRVGRLIQNKIKDLEKKAVNLSDLVVTVTEQDALKYRDLGYDLQDYIVIPNAPPEIPSNPDEIAPVNIEGIPSDAHLCIFVGANTEPNRDGVERLIDMMPDLQPDTYLAIVGSVSEAFTETQTPENMVLCGFVDDLSGYYSRADVALNPVSIGSGSNIKLGEYMAFRLPVVTTEFGTRGYPVIDGEHLVIAEIGEFPNQIQGVLQRKRFSEQLSGEARVLMEENINWTSLSQNLFYKLRKYAEC